MLPNKNEFITKINKITIEVETQTKDEEIRSRIIEYTPVLPEGIYHLCRVTATTLKELER